MLFKICTTVLLYVCAARTTEGNVLYFETKELRGENKSRDRVWFVRGPQNLFAYNLIDCLFILKGLGSSSSTQAQLSKLTFSLIY